MILIRPTRGLVESFVGKPPLQEAMIRPLFRRDEWDKDHREFVLLELLPDVRPDKRTWRIVAEAYLTDFLIESTGEVKPFEQVICDGSSLVPDLAYKWGEIKDPWAMGHDLIFFLHRFGLEDAYGKKWTFNEANLAYRRGWYCQHLNIIGNLWWLGLSLGGWVSWFKRFNERPEPLTSIREKQVY